MALATWATSLSTDRLDALINGGIRAEASQVVRRTAIDVLAMAQGLAPVDTGHLKASLQPGGEDNIFDFDPGALVAVVGTAVPYGVYQEFGTRHQPAQPFLTPAVEAARPSFENTMSQLMAKAAR